ncbi:MAG TPA: hypothetical protein VIZ20_21660 [Streptosporangiaceae bacterium]
MLLDISRVLLTNRLARRRFRREFPSLYNVFVAAALAFVGMVLTAAALTTSNRSAQVALLLVIAPLTTTSVGMMLKARGRHRRRIVRLGLAGLSVHSLTSVAALLAGREGLALLDESDAHLAGQSGHDPASWAKLKEAAGFVIAGVRYRGQDWADAAWKPADAVLRSRFLSGLFVVIPTMVVAAEVLTNKGTIGMFTSFGSIFGVGAFLAGVIKAGRWYRNVEPPEPKARQARK